jgi:hypothetical protein
MLSESFLMVHWCGGAAAESVPETVIAAVLLLHERSVDEIASKLSKEASEKITLVLEGIGDDQIRVNSSSLEGAIPGDIMCSLPSAVVRPRLRDS